MEQNSPHNNDLLILEAQIRECYGRVVYSHKTQEKCADIIYGLHKKIKLFQIILSACVTSSILIKVFGDNEWSLITAAVLSTVLLALNTYIKDYDLGEVAQKHTVAANDLWDVRETYLSILTDIQAGLIQANAIVLKRDDLQKRLATVYSGSPRTTSKAYQKASKALKNNEELTFSEKEIDLLLPAALRKEKITL